jgi:hypothetical protein
MLAPLWFFGFDSLMEFIGFAIASAVAYQALKGYRLSKERTLLYLNLSFGLLGAGLLIDERVADAGLHLEPVAVDLPRGTRLIRPFPWPAPDHQHAKHQRRPDPHHRGEANQTRARFVKCLLAAVAICNQRPPDAIPIDTLV